MKRTQSGGLRSRHDTCMEAEDDLKTFTTLPVTHIRGGAVFMLGLMTKLCGNRRTKGCWHA